MARTSLVLVAVLMSASPACADAAASGSEETGAFEFQGGQSPITVWFYRPPALASGTRVVFLLHGDSRTGREARDLGAPFAREGRFILVAPEFSEENFPRDAYSFGGMVDSSLHLRPRNQWALAAIERLFDHLVARWHLDATTYDVIGHSGGAQYLHRLVLFVPEARFRRAIASSPGRYAFPTSAIPVPYGMKGTDSLALLKKALQRDFILLLADRDTVDREREPQAMEQGANRFARGLRFFAAATEQATQLGVPLRWQLRINPGADHSPQAAVAAAFKILTERPGEPQ